MKVAQRAYLAIRNGKVTRIYRPNNALHQIGLPATAAVEYDFEIHNLGETPASVLDYHMRFEVPDGWKMLSQFIGGKPEPAIREQALGDIPQHSIMKSRPGRASFNLTNEAWRAWEDLLRPRPGYALGGHAYPAYGTLRYRDIFGDEHELNWCWLIFFVGDNGAGEPLEDCNQVGFSALP